MIALETHCIRHGMKVNQEAGPASPSSLSTPPVVKRREGRSEKSAKACFNSAQLKVKCHFYHSSCLKIFTLLAGIHLKSGEWNG